MPLKKMKENYSSTRYSVKNHLRTPRKTSYSRQTLTTLIQAEMIVTSEFKFLYLGRLRTPDKACNKVHKAVITNSQKGSAFPNTGEESSQTFLAQVIKRAQQLITKFN